MRGMTQKAVIHLLDEPFLVAFIFEPVTLCVKKELFGN